tara:strand:- start:111 stop:305 length:195 start_codon:yes stop_codon:yes gene_type:complete
LFEQYVEWLEVNSDKLDEAELTRIKGQQEYVTKICAVFEDTTLNEEDTSAQVEDLLVKVNRKIQ